MRECLSCLLYTGPIMEFLSKSLCERCRQAGAAGIRPGKASRFVGLSKKFNRWKALIKVRFLRSAKSMGHHCSLAAAERAQGSFLVARPAETLK